MKITIEIHWYKDTGKWYSSDKITVDCEMQLFTDNDLINVFLMNKYPLCKTMDYTFEARYGDAVNKRLVKHNTNHFQY